MRELLVEAAGGDDALRTLDDRPLPDEDFDWSGIPDDVHDKVAEVLALTDGCCDDLLDVEYRTACRRLLARAAAGDPAVFRRRASSATAAAAICWIVGKDNDLFRPSGGRMLVKDLMAHFGLAQGGVSQRAETLLKAGGFDPSARRLGPATRRPRAARLPTSAPADRPARRVPHRRLSNSRREPVEQRLGIATVDLAAVLDVELVRLVGGCDVPSGG